MGVALPVVLLSARRIIFWGAGGGGEAGSGLIEVESSWTTASFPAVVNGMAGWPAVGWAGAAEVVTVAGAGAGLSAGAGVGAGGVASDATGVASSVAVAGAVSAGEAVLEAVWLSARRMAFHGTGAEADGVSTSLELMRTGGAEAGPGGTIAGAVGAASTARSEVTQDKRAATARGWLARAGFRG
jgi:hypothetical protein